MPTPTPHVVKVRHLFDRERAGIDETGGMQDVQTWQVQTDQMSFSSAQAMFAVDPFGVIVPPWYSRHEIFTFLAVTNVLPERVKESPLVHNVYVTFSVPKIGGPPEGRTKWSVSVTVRPAPRNETLTRTFPVASRYGGKRVAIANSMGLSYGGVEETYHDREVIVRYATSEQSFDMGPIDACDNCVNTNEFSLRLGGDNSTPFQFQQYTTRFVDFTVEEVLTVSPDGTGTVTYPVVSLSLIYRKPGFSGDRPWDRKLADNYQAADGTVLLDGNGQPLTIPAPPTPIEPVIYDADAAVGGGQHRGYPTIGEADFTDLLSEIES